MKLSKLFHTLYATVMALPVLIIPIFAININQKSVEPIQVEVQEKISVDFNQLFDGEQTYELDRPQNFISNINTDYDITHKYIFRWSYSYNEIDNSFYFIPGFWNSGTLSSFKRWPLSRLTTNQGTYTYLCDYSLSQGNLNTFVDNQILLQCQGDLLSTTNLGYVNNLNVFDITKMFGAGNEPTTTEFNNMFTEQYYPYTESQIMLVNKPTATIYNDTDIGSQFLYSLYIPVNDYFNFGDFFGLGGMYDWFQLNIFNGTAPLSFFIVFNVMIYWLFISLFWLLFDILIYVPMVIHKWLDKAEM